MRAGEFIRRTQMLGVVRGIPVRFDVTCGKGSRGTLYNGDRFTVVKDGRRNAAHASSRRCLLI